MTDEQILQKVDEAMKLGRKQALEEVRAEIVRLKFYKAQFLTSDNQICIDSQDVLDVIDKCIKEG